MSSQQIDQLIALLDRLTDLCDRLHDLVAEERRALVELKFDRVEQLAQDKHPIIRQLLDERDLGRELIDAIGRAEAGIRVESVSQLLPHLGGADSSRLGQAYLRFQARARAVENLSRINRSLAEGGGKVTEEMLRSLTGAMGGGATYDRPGKGKTRSELPIGRVAVEA